MPSFSAARRTSATAAASRRSTAGIGNTATPDASKVLTATGNATVNGNFVNNGVVNGPTGAGQLLTFTQFVDGAGTTTGNTEYAGGYKFWQ